MFMFLIISGFIFFFLIKDMSISYEDILLNNISNYLINKLILSIDSFDSLVLSFSNSFFLFVK